MPNPSELMDMIFGAVDDRDSVVYVVPKTYEPDSFLVDYASLVFSFTRERGISYTIDIIKDRYGPQPRTFKINKDPITINDYLARAKLIAVLADAGIIRRDEKWIRDFVNVPNYGSATT